MPLISDVTITPSRYFDIKRDKTFPYFCQACVVGKIESQMSKTDTRYCLECQPLIEEDYKQRRESYKPVTDVLSYTAKKKEVLLHTKNKDTHAYQNPAEDRPKPNVGGRPKKDIPVQLICRLSQEGLAIKPIVLELKRQEYTLSAMTVSRVLSGHRNENQQGKGG